MVLFGIAIGILYQSNISLIKANYCRLATRDKPSYYRLVAGRKQVYRLAAESSILTSM